MNPQTPQCAFVVETPLGRMVCPHDDFVGYVHLLWGAGVGHFPACAMHAEIAKRLDYAVREAGA